jgi:multisubunit Na+/H+ antiporter MnhC subunit
VTVCSSATRAREHGSPGLYTDSSYQSGAATPLRQATISLTAIIAGMKCHATLLHGYARRWR